MSPNAKTFPAGLLHWTGPPAIVSTSHWVTCCRMIFQNWFAQVLISDSMPPSPSFSVRVQLRELLKEPVGGSRPLPSHTKYRQANTRHFAKTMDRQKALWRNP